MLRVPFSSEEFFAVFSAYNQSVWPIQLVLLAAGLAGYALVLARGRRASRCIWAILAALWLWTGVAYHLLHFSRINPAAFGFGALFVLQAGLMLWHGTIRDDVALEARGDVRGALGGLLVGYALVVYPLIGMLSEHGFAASPSFGAPCPVVIYTFGVMLMTTDLPLRLLVVPVIWAAIGSSAFVSFGVWQDVALPVGAGIVLGFALRDRWYVGLSARGA